MEAIFNKEITKRKKHDFPFISNCHVGFAVCHENHVAVVVVWVVSAKLVIEMSKKRSPRNHSNAVTKKEMIEMNSTASAIQGVFDNLRMQLQILDNEIKADEKSKAEFERHLQILLQRKEDIEIRIKQNEEWSKSYDSDIGPFAQK